MKASDFPALDLTEALDRVEGDKQFYFELVDSFFEEYPKNLDKIKQAIEANDPVALDKSAHYVKSALGNLSAKAGYNLAHALEKVGKSNQMSDAVNLLKEFEISVSNFKEATNLERAK